MMLSETGFRQSPSESIGKATSQGAGAPIEPPPGEVKSKGRRRPRVKKAEKPNGPLPDVAQPAPEISKVVPFPNMAQPAPEAPKMAQQDAAKAFFEATANSQAFQAATEGLLGAVHLGLPDADVYFRTKPIEEVINPDGTKGFLNQAIVSLYKLPDGARKRPLGASFVARRQVSRPRLQGEEGENPGLPTAFGRRSSGDALFDPRPS